MSMTKLIHFNVTRKFLFEPQFSIDGKLIEVVNQTKLLGLTVSDNCKWDENTKDIVSKGNGRLCFLRRLKTLGASIETLLDIYRLFCRSVLEYRAPVWSGALTTGNKQDIERVQKNAFLVQPLPIMRTAFYKLVKTHLKSEGTNSALMLLRTV